LVLALGTAQLIAETVVTTLQCAIGKLIGLDNRMSSHYHGAEAGNGYNG